MKGLQLFEIPVYTLKEKHAKTDNFIDQEATQWDKGQVLVGAN